MTRRIDKDRKQKALAQLDALVEAHPELRAPEARARLTGYLEAQMAKTNNKNTGVFVRLSDELLACIDTYLERLGQEHPALMPSRSDAIRILVYKGLETEGLAPGRNGAA